MQDSLDDVDAYLKKHEDLLKSLDAQEERFTLLTKTTEARSTSYLRTLVSGH